MFFLTSLLTVLFSDTNIQIETCLHLPAKMVSIAMQMEGPWSLASLPLLQMNKIQGSLGVEASQTQVQVPEVRNVLLTYLFSHICRPSSVYLIQK